MVKQERDVDKAVKVARWLSYIVEQEVLESEVGDDIKEGWGHACLDVKKCVQDAIVARGMPEVDLD